MPELKPAPDLKPAADANPSPEAKPPREASRSKADRTKAEPVGPAPADFALAEDEAPLLSPETDKAVASAFEALSANLAARTAELAEGVAREMLRPMLKAWLDENLPAIVERLVSAEIERIVRAAR